MFKNVDIVNVFFFIYYYMGILNYIEVNIIKYVLFKILMVVWFNVDFSK